MPASSIVATTHMKAKKALEAADPAFQQAQREKDAADAEARADAKAAADAAPPSHPIVACFEKLLDVLGSMPVQTLLFVVFVVVFQSLGDTMRKREEYFLDKHVMDRIVMNHFDSSHNNFLSIRRIADIYEWGNRVLFPGLLADMGPCADNVGTAGAAKTCVDFAWPDGEGPFHMDGASPWSVADMVERMDMLDWTDGIQIWQTRAADSTTDCATTSQLGACIPEFDRAVNEASSASFGYNKTHPTSALDHPFEYFTSADLGGSPDGISSASIPSMKNYDKSGFVAIIIPFFSDTYIPFEEGVAGDITNFKDSYVTPTNGRTPSFHCVRTSTNGRHIVQLCDPGTNGDGTGALTGAVRAQIEQFWNDLKRGHWLDARTRAMAVVLQLRSNHVGLRYRISMMIEQSSVGGLLLPSYDVETLMLDTDMQSWMGTYAWVGLGLVIFFCVSEAIEIVRGGIIAYIQDLWNIMDWLNFILYFLTFWSIMATLSSIENHDCTSYLCASVGYHDDYRTMGQFRTTKMYLSMCVCIQLLKILKFADALIPKFSLATAVLKHCVVDLAFFMGSFFISLFAFSAMLYVQLGTVMEDFVTQEASIISLFRALFGDFDIDEIMDNSSGYLNALFFLTYLFVAIFIMLSMFLAILAEAQIRVRDDEAEKKKDPNFRMYGVVAHSYEAVEKLLGRARSIPADANATPETPTSMTTAAPASCGEISRPSRPPPPMPVGAGGEMARPQPCSAPAGSSCTPNPGARFATPVDPRAQTFNAGANNGLVHPQLAPCTGGTPSKAGEPRQSPFPFNLFGDAEVQQQSRGAMVPLGRGASSLVADGTDMQMQMLAAVRELAASQTSMHAEMRRQREEIKALADALALRWPLKMDVYDHSHGRSNGATPGNPNRYSA